MVDAEDDVGEEERRLDGAAPATANAICTKEDGRGHGDTNQGGIKVADLRELGDSPEEVDGAGDDGAREDEEDNL